MNEQLLHNLIIQNRDIQQTLLNVLNIDSNYEFVSEDQYPNGLYADFTIKSGNKVRAILELKGSDIGVNDFVRGIGQVLQYQHFANQKLSLKSYEYEDTSAVLMFPSSIIRNRNFNIGVFEYPKGSKVLEFNDINYNIREITKEELSTLANAINNDLVAISQYYVRDTRLFELYLCLKYLQIKKIQGYTSIDRRETEEQFLRRLNTPNNRNWRNVFISLSSINLIDRNNLPTTTGAKYADMPFEEFAYEMYSSYLNPYLNLMLDVLKEFNDLGRWIVATYPQISGIISSKFRGKKVLFLTDSDNRYLSSWLNIMRDDFGCVQFEPRSNNRKIIYDLSELSKTAVTKYISQNSIAYEYIEKFNLLF
ncbi:hypothetical protein [Acholeplasma oculi]|nr:hypothetical protein [Acholeplasma oculi]